MGVLDDAIREHLELKRKHGAAEEELQRQEEEALGPARRDVAHQHEEEAEPAAATTAQETALFDGDDAPAADVLIARDYRPGRHRSPHIATDFAPAPA